MSYDGGAKFNTVALPDLHGLETRASVAAGFGVVWVAFQAVHGGLVEVKTLAGPVSGTGSVGTLTVETLPGSQDGRLPDIALRPGGAAVVTYGHGQFSPTPTVGAQIDGDGLGGAGFGPRIPIANVPGYPHLPRPKVAVDGGTGRIYVTYADRQDGPGPEDIRVNFSDDGSEWSPAITVSDPVASRDRKLPDLAVDEGGEIGFAWYDFRNGGPQLWGEVRPGLVRPPEPRAPLKKRYAASCHTSIDAWTKRRL